MLEHVISEKRVLRSLMRAFDPLHVRIFGAHVARDTASNVRTAGFIDVTSRNLALDIVRHIQATKG